VQAYARLIARQQQGVEGTALAEAQRDVIKTLSAQLDSAGRDPVRAPSAHSHHAEVQCSPSKVAHLTGLCALIARQVEDFRAAAHEGVPSELEAVLNTLHVLHNELTMLGADHEAHKVPALPGAEQPTAPPSPSVAGSTRQEESEAQIIELAEKVAALTQRIALLTASNAAAQEEAAQARAAAVSLAEEVDVVQCEARRAIAQRAEENEAIMQQLAQAHAECRRLAAALAEADDAALLKETALREAMAKQAQAREPRDGFANPLTQQQQERPHPPAGLAALLDGMDGLLADAAAMEERLHQLEGQAAEAAELRSAAAQNRWQGLTVAAACAQGAAAAWAGARADVTAAEQRCAEHAQRAKQLAEHVRQLEAENTELCRRLDAMRALHDEQSSRMAELHAAQLAAAEAKLHAQKQELNRHADAAVAAAVAAAEAHTKERVGQGLEDALRELEGCQRECVRLRAERDAAYAEFKRFREIKAAEVQLLEQRLGLENGVSSNAADADEAEMLVAAASGEIAAACRADAVAAALREAKLERKHRMEVQHALAALRAEEKKAQAARKAAEKEAAALRQRLREASVAAEQQIRELTTQVTQARKEADATLAAAADQAVEVLSLNERLEKTAAAVVERNRRLQAVEEAEVDKARAALAARSAALRDVAGRVMRAEHEVELLKDDLDKCSVTSQEDDVFQ